MQENPSPQRNYKDKLFVRLFSEPKDALSLFNALNGTSYQNSDELQIATLEDAVYVGWKNDVAILCHNHLQLYEQQSTQNPNMPLRDFIYCAREYEGFIKRMKLDIYGKTLVKIPTPKCVTLYNGAEEMPEYSEEHLSDAFMDKTGGYEWTVYSYNINPGYKIPLINSCHTLEGYSVFIDKIRKNHKAGFELKDAIQMSAEYCISHNLLKDFLLKHTGEALNMILSLYDEELHNQTIREEGRLEGLNQGLSQGLSQGRNQIISNMLQAGMPLETIAKIAETSTADIMAIQKNGISNL